MAAAGCLDVAEPTVRTRAAVLLADPRRLHTVLRILVANDLAHGAPHVLVDVRGGEDVVEVRVPDHGDGVPGDLETSCSTGPSGATRRGGAGELD